MGEPGKFSSLPFTRGGLGWGNLNNGDSITLKMGEPGKFSSLPFTRGGLGWGSYLNNPEQLWLRWWDLDGNLLLVGQEEAQLQKLRAEKAEVKAAQLAARLRAMGIDPNDDL